MIREEVYKLECATCFGTIEIPAAPADATGRSCCPRCGSTLDIQWLPAAREGRRREAA